MILYTALEGFQSNGREELHDSVDVPCSLSKYNSYYGEQKEVQ